MNSEERSCSNGSREGAESILNQNITCHGVDAVDAEDSLRYRECHRVIYSNAIERFIVNVYDYNVS